jgi:hypothetical protein
LLAHGSDDVAPVADLAAAAVDDQSNEDAVTSLLPQDSEALSALLDRLIKNGEVVLPGAA